MERNGRRRYTQRVVRRAALALDVAAPTIDRAGIAERASEIGARDNRHRLDGEWNLGWRSRQGVVVSELVLVIAAPAVHVGAGPGAGMQRSGRELLDDKPFQA